MLYPLITVSIPVYNCEKYIERSINSVLKQTYPNIEILLVNDRGNDTSSEIIKRIQFQYPEKIRIIEHKSNQGLSIVRNTGIDHAKGEFLFFLDSDDEIVPTCLEELFNLINKTKTTMVVGETVAKNTFKNSEYKIFSFNHSLISLTGNDTIFEYFCKGSWPVNAWNKLFKVDFFRKHKIYFIKDLFSQDELWSFHTALKLDSIAFLHKTTYFYYLHSESIIFNKTKRNFENHQTIVEYFTQAYEKATPLRKKFMLKHIISFKETTLSMQWKCMKEDVSYWKQNYQRLKKAPSLSIFDYFSSFYSMDQKKKNLFQNLPVAFGYKLFKWRFERK
jgi:glycosyltransferase involved in cell wall biosynthesis